MMDAKDIAELDRLLDRLLADQPEGDAPRARSTPALRASLMDAIAAQDSHADRPFERSVALASALAVLDSGRSNDEDHDARLGRATNLLLAMEVRRLRSAHARAELDAAQWRERMVEATCESAAGSAANATSEDDSPPWDPRRQRQKLDQIADLIGAFKGSLHWRIGHAVVAVAERLLLRKSRPTALDAAESLARSDSP